ncbi:23S rRNA (uracil(1939)-C(5))-methyltransferase RlmD [Geomonas limicola]|uniref:23S rRNA (uracil(1939)-C(5))-methyltransferase RlmD n=1 Tax=Geomonas limicola TaxID=2740186 RepID=UPI001FEC095C|nr:23S rRNA (uracil(1939)-C(5))-methyltransferase RlmD [Geomonas limicola]
MPASDAAPAARSAASTERVPKRDASQRPAKNGPKPTRPERTARPAAPADAGRETTFKKAATPHTATPQGEARQQGSKAPARSSAPEQKQGRPKRNDSPSHFIEPAPQHGLHKPRHPHGAEQLGKLHSGKIIEVSIASTSNDGFGVAQYEGSRVLVAGGIPGEQLLVKITYVGRRESFGNIMRCVKSSPERETAPACQMGKCCDSCGLMQLRYPAQLSWKKDLVTRELRAYQSLAEVKIHDTIGSPKELNYRNSAKLVVAGKHSDPVIGIYRRNTHDVLEIADCPLHHPLINKVVKVVKAGIKKGKVPIYNPKSEMGLLRYLVVRVAEPSDKVMVVFVTSEQGYNEMHHLAKHVQQAIPEVVVVAQNINNSTGNVIFGQKERFITKAQTLYAKLGNKTFSLSPHSFFQVNSGAAQIIYEKVREFAKLTGTERVLDVYCGIGGISLFLADKADEVVGIEFVDSAVADAMQNAALNGIDNCDFEAGDAAKIIEEIGHEGGAHLIVLNPPRKGCEEKVLKSVAGIKPQRIIYVSCSPETLARDLDILSRLGYRTLEVQPVDMFPQTVHVEDVALLERI